MKLDRRLDLYPDSTNAERARGVVESVDSEELGVPENSGEHTRRRGLSVVVLNLDLPELIVPLVERLLEQRAVFQDRELELEILIGDTGSSDPEVLRAFERWQDDLIIERDLTYHFSKCNNRLARRSSCDTLLLLNSDIVLPEGRETLLALCREFEADASVGILGAVLFFPEGTIQHRGVELLREDSRRAFPFHAHARARVASSSLPRSMLWPATTGSFLAIRRRLFEIVGGFSESYAVECQDIDLCLRAHRMGYSTKVLSLGEVIHLENGTRPKGDEHWPDRRLFVRRWRSYAEAHFL